MFQTPPADLTLPANATVVATTNARGVQIYRCYTSPTTSFTWTFVAPEASLVDANNQPVATHSAGPTWLWNDGSSITGKLLQQSPSPIAGAIPWLLLQAVPVPATPTGILTPVTFVRRSNTQGGAAPATGCDANSAGTVIRVPYVATYTFYRSN